MGSRENLKQSRVVIVDVVARLLQAQNVEVERADIVHDALARFSAGPGDFADHLIAATNIAGGCRATVTFDEDASRTPGFIKLAPGSP